MIIFLSFFPKNITNKMFDNIIDNKELEKIYISNDDLGKDVDFHEIKDGETKILINFDQNIFDEIENNEFDEKTILLKMQPHSVGWLFIKKVQSSMYEKYTKKLQFFSPHILFKKSNKKKLSEIVFSWNKEAVEPKYIWKNKVLFGESQHENINNDKEIIYFPICKI